LVSSLILYLLFLRTARLNLGDPRRVAVAFQALVVCPSYFFSAFSQVGLIS
jgi:hypothetical protein